jgi:hypothetical protein
MSSEGWGERREQVEWLIIKFSLSYCDTGKYIYSLMNVSIPCKLVWL